MAEDTVQILFRGTADYRRKLQQEALNRGMKVQTLLERAIERFLEQPSPAASAQRPSGFPYREENRELHDKLEAILNSGDEGVIGAVKPNIEVFFDRMKPPIARRKSGS